MTRQPIENQQYPKYLIGGLCGDVFEDAPVDEVFFSAVWCGVEQAFVWAFCGEGKGSHAVHDEVDLCDIVGV